MTGPRVISADDLCVAAETVLKAKLPVLTALLEVDDSFGPIQTWQQVPTIAALSTARFPAIAVASSGLAEPPRRTRSTGYTATWRVTVGIYDRGTDHADTQARARKWASYVRTVLLANPSLGGVASSMTWTGEELAVIPQRDSARTIGAAAVAFNISADNVADPGAGTDLPLVLSTHPSLTLK